MADAPVVDWTGPCPKCGYVRTAADTNPAWQCPRCQIAYNKYAAAWSAPVQLVAKHAGAIVDRASSDHSLAGLVAANVIALALAWFTGMTLRDLMLVYWIQSVVIGVTSVIRILKLHQFSTSNMTMNSRPVPENAAGKRQIAGFFILHYGFFHFVYFMFIAVGDKHHPAAGLGSLGSPLGYALVALSFVVSHAFSLRHNLESDASGRPNAGVLMMLPYARILPMHLTIIFGLGVASGSSHFGYAFLLFGGLKTLADCVMHLVEHHILAQNAKQAAESADVPLDTSAER